MTYYYHSQTSLFNYACQYNAIEIVQLLLKHPKVDVDSFASGKTPLHTACSHGHLGVAELLINDKRVDIQKTFSLHENTLLHVACYNGHPKIVELLLTDKRINPCTVDLFGNTPLHDACYCHESMKLLLDDDRVDVNQRDVANRTPLMQAVEFGSVLCVEHILASNKLINHIYEGTRIASDDIKALLDDYRARPREMKHRLRIKTGLNKVDAASVFIDIQLLCDGYLAFVPDIPNSVLRFFKLLLLFPVELQMLICNHLYQVKAQFISPTLICNGILKFVAKK